MVVHCPGNANATGRCERLQTRSDIHTVAEDVVLLDDHVAEIDADAKPDASLVWHLRFAVNHASLHLDRTAHCINDTRKFRQHTVASVLYGPAPMLLDLRINQLPEMRL